MLTPIEIQNKTFKAVGLGYDKRDVDIFMQEVADSYESVYREKVELDDKVNALIEALNHYKSIEKMMQKALILAEKTAEETKTAAIQNARQIENDAVTRSQIILSDARRELDNIRQQIITMTQTFETYKINFKNLANAQIELVNSDSFNIKTSGLDFEDIPQSVTDYSEETGYESTSEDDQNSDFDIINTDSVD